MTERIVIGETNETRRHLEDGTGNIYLDCTRPLGKLLIDFEADSEREWNVNLSQLRESYSKVVRQAERWKMAAPVSDFLQGKYASGEPSTLFAAIRTWEEYLNCFNLNHGADLLIQRLSSLYRPFFLYSDNRPWQEEAIAALSNALRDEETAVEAKREYDERAKDDSLEQSHERAYYYWYNRLRKLKRAKNLDADKISVVSEAFEIFRKEAVERKGMARRGEIEPKEYTDWLFKQQNEVDRLMDG